MIPIPIRAWREQGIPGGWKLSVSVKIKGGRKLLIEADGEEPQNIVAMIYDTIRNNGGKPDESKIWDLAIGIWKQRCIKNGQANRIL